MKVPVFQRDSLAIYVACYALNISSQNCYTTTCMPHSLKIEINFVN